MTRAVYIVLCVLLLCYLALRAIYVPLVHDEAATFYHYIHSGNFWPYFAHWDANNHILNSLLSNISFHLFGHEYWALRLPNVLAFVVYAFYTWKLTTNISNKWLQLACAVAMLTARLLFELFAMARGYGLSMALLLGAVYYLSLFLKEYKNKNLAILLLFMSLAVSANLSLLNSFGILLGIAFIAILTYFKRINNKKQLFISFVLLLLMGIVPYLAATYYAFDLKEKGALYYGALNGFVPVTLNTILDFTIGSHYFAIQLLVSLLFFAVLFLGLKQLFSETKIKPELLITAALLLGNWLGAILLAKILKVNYPEDRAGLYFVPMLLLGTGYLIQSLVDHKKYWQYLGVLFLFFPVKLAITANIGYVDLWISQSVSPAIYSKVQQLQSTQKQPLLVGGYRLQMISWQHLGLNKQNQLLPLGNQDFPSIYSDLILLKDTQLYRFETTHTLIMRDEANKLSLLKRNTPLQLTPRKEYSFDNIKGKQEYFNFVEVLDTLPSKYQRFMLSLELNAEEPNFMAQIVISYADKNGNSLYYDFIPLHWMHPKWENQELKLLRNIPPAPKDAHRLVVYLWNINKITYSLKNIQFKTFSLQQ